MSRSLRILYPGAYYHVMNRGIGKRIIFHDASHYKLFLELLSEANIRYGAEILAYCLMSNHYHICIRTKFPNLNEIMRFINGVFTQKINKLTKSDGAIFRGRYKAILIDSNSYLLEVNRYIHLNPVLAKIASKPEDYQWSSYHHYINEKNIPPWLFCRDILNCFGHENQIVKFRKFVMDDIEKEIKEFYNDYEKIPNYEKIPVLGSKIFIKNINDQHIKSAHCNDIPQQKRIKNFLLPSIEKIIEYVGKYYNVESSKITTYKCKRLGNLPRKMAVYIACNASGKTHKEIASSFTGLSPSSISKLYFRVKDEIKNNEKLSQDVELILMNLSNARI